MPSCNHCGIEVDERQLQTSEEHDYYLCIACNSNYTDEEIIENMETKENEI